uniref:Uncharacterized protein n=1 Tax=Avena sativa TaxID=4498 RepID=A0ACD6AJT5_AVESA
MSGPPVFSMLQAGNPTHNLQGQQISMIGHGHPSQQGVYVMDSSFSQGIYADKQSSFAERVNMMQLNKCMADSSSPAGRRCESLGCKEAAEGQTVLCKNHRVGQHSQMAGCPQILPDGISLCMSHGGGHLYSEPGSAAVPFTKSESSMKYEGDGGFRLMENAGNAMGSTEIYNPDGEVVMCNYQGCNKRTQGNTVYCKVHSGASKACMVEGCTKGAHGGTPLCIGHGGGKRCSVAGCSNAACGSSQGRTDCCVRHGGGKRCKHDGCGKGAQGNTDFCIAHGGGRRCKFEGCGKSAQGRSDYCIKHGGGRRCKFQGCSASSKWGVDFCSTHRKSMLSGGDSADGVLPAPQPKRRAKKAGTKKTKKAKSTVEPAGASENVTMSAIPATGVSENVAMSGIPEAGVSENVTMSAMPATDMPEMGTIHVTDAGSDHLKSPESAIMKQHSAVACQQPPHSESPSGLAASTEGVPALGNRVLFGL